MKKTNKNLAKAASPRKAESGKTTIARDLMKAIYVFGRHDGRFVTELDEAVSKVKAGEDFYLRVGDDVFEVATWFYQASNIPQGEVIQRLHTLFAPPEAMGL